MATHVEMLVKWFAARSNVATLREIMHSDEPWSYEFRARLCDARDQQLINGWECDQSRAKATGRKTDHIYRILPMHRFKEESNGQTVFA
jgi:hypothetical protein